LLASTGRSRALHVGELLALAASWISGPLAGQTCTPTVAGSELVKPGSLVMATNPTLPPMQFVDSSGELQGMRIILGREIARRLCLRPEYVRIEFSAMIPGLRAARWDVINTGLFWNPERARIMQLVPYELQAVSVSVVNGNPLKVGRPEDLAGRSVGVELGGFEEKALRTMNTSLTDRGLHPITIRIFDNFAAAYQALSAGQLDAVVTIDSTAEEYARKGRFDRPLHGLYPAPVAFGMKSKVLSEAIVKVLNDMLKDGSYAKLMNEYGLLANTEPFSIRGPPD
jgi:polar amino acid transport system substrate-binding protein